MGRRRDTISEPPQSYYQQPSRRQQQQPPRRQPPVKQSECGFDWTPGVVLALLGAFTWLSHDFDKYKRKHEGCDADRRRDDRSRDSDRGRRRHRSSSRYDDDDDYYYRRDRGYSR
ncbi:hypothetical protein FSARC_11509 [Fusarium sarcochroum]|uniref:Uncharacterized protein n=1 Tax=Fusarium sarcochroum TaxID=1208366 RepID=A0A8H4TEU9_9HYPO|nr:hypothetical protein FSARC_11509 [Fusarium sarcochroum]